MTKPMASLREDAPLVLTIKEILSDYSALRSHFIWALVQIRRGINPLEEYREERYNALSLEDYTRQKSRYVRERCGKLARAGVLHMPPAQRDYGNHLYNFNVYSLPASEAAMCRDKNQFYSHSRNRTLSHKLAEMEYLADIEIGCAVDQNLRFLSPRNILDNFPEQSLSSKSPMAIENVPIKADGKILHFEVRPDQMFGIEYLREKKSLRFVLEANQATENTDIRSKKNVSLEKRLKERKGFMREVLLYQSIVQRKLYQKHWGLPNMLLVVLGVSERHIQNLMSVGEREMGGACKWIIYDHAPKFGSLPPKFPTGASVHGLLKRVGFDPCSMRDLLRNL